MVLKISFGWCIFASSKLYLFLVTANLAFQPSHRMYAPIGSPFRSYLHSRAQLSFFKIFDFDDYPHVANDYGVKDWGRWLEVNPKHSGRSVSFCQ